MSSESAVYTHGYHPSVLRSHSWRTAANSAAYLLPLLKPDMRILDIGCGPGTISIDFATLVPAGSVVGLDIGDEVVQRARENAEARGVANVSFATGDVNALKFPDGAFDVVHAHQVLQHVGDPVQALREMRRVTKPGGLVATREADMETFVWYPELPGHANWKAVFLKTSRANGGEPFAGRRLHAWARQAGFDPTKITKTTSSWCFSTPEEVTWWGDLWAERTIASSFAKGAVDGGFATQEDIESMSKAWRQWSTEEDGWFGMMHGEVVCRV